MTSKQAHAIRPLIRTCLLTLVVGLGAIGPSPAESGADGRPSSQASVPFTPRTRVSLIGEKWLINEEPAYRGTRAEGLLMNVRMVNSVFEDGRKPDFDPNASTD